MIPPGYRSLLEPVDDVGDKLVAGGVDAGVPFEDSVVELLEAGC